MARGRVLGGHLGSRAGPGRGRADGAGHRFRDPTAGGPPGPDATFRYFEAYRQTRHGSELIEYAGGLWVQRGLGSLEYHWLPLPWTAGLSVFLVQSDVTPRESVPAHRCERPPPRPPPPTCLRDLDDIPHHANGNRLRAPSRGPMGPDGARWGPIDARGIASGHTLGVVVRGVAPDDAFRGPLPGPNPTARSHGVRVTRKPVMAWTLAVARSLGGDVLCVVARNANQRLRARQHSVRPAAQASVSAGTGARLFLPPNTLPGPGVNVRLDGWADGWRPRTIAAGVTPRSPAACESRATMNRTPLRDVRRARPRGGCA